ncbi:hypothetical protein [Kineothrix sedimenti]|uniref:Uncharacterized protein n=1 Tax=Kineothrix sedimenti TaxID=3123317 RepID=A0ABZ3EU55_9FIRM
MSRILPALFNGDMVKAILREPPNNKTVTRRLVKLPRYVTEDEDGTFTLQEEDFGYSSGWSMGELIANQYIKPGYKVGDILYVRETQSVHRVNDKGTCYVRVHYKADDKAMDFTVSSHEWERLAKYDYTDEVFISPYWLTKETARIWLKVTDVRVERLQDITEEQARAEGCIDYHDKTGNGKFDDVLEFDLTARDAFVDLWNSTLKKDSEHTWAHNPWVWVYEFERCEKPEGALKMM